MQESYHTSLKSGYLSTDIALPGHSGEHEPHRTMNAIKETTLNVWDSTVGRMAIAALTLGWVPFALMSFAACALKS